MRKLIAAAAVALAGATLCSCAQGEDAVTATLAALDDMAHFGTLTRWVYVEEETPDPAPVWEQLTARAEEIEQASSAEIDDSDISRFNAAQPGERVSIGEDAYAMLTAARKIYDETDGAYNPATGLLVDLWGFSPRHRKANYAPEKPYDREDFLTELPAERYLDAFSSEEILDFSAVTLGEDESGYYAVKPADAFVEVDGVVYTMQLNLSGIGKGYCADEGEEILRAAGQTYGYYNVGSSSMALLADPTREGNIWEFTVASPRQFSSQSHYASVRARDAMLATSGDYEQYYELEGVRYCHIIDPDTGYPVGAAPVQDGSHIVCATVLGGGAAEGDARATALCCMTLEEALAYCRAHSEAFRAIFIWYDAAADAYGVWSNLQTWSLTEPTLSAEEI